MVVYSERPASMYSQLQVKLHYLANNCFAFSLIVGGLHISLSSSHYESIR